MQQKLWYRLDNAAKMYPSVRTKKWSGNFRVSLSLKEDIDPVVLQQALDDLRKRIVNLNLVIKRGFFWYYFEETQNQILVEPDKKYPCRNFPKNHNNNDVPYRVCWFKKRIAIDFFHALTDGSGAMVILKSLTARYLFLKYGTIVKPCDGVILCDSEQDDEELEDAFKRYARFRTIKSRSELKGYHYKGTKLPFDQTSVVTGIIPTKTILSKSKEYNVSLTEFIVAVMIKSFMQCQGNDKCRVQKPVKVCVPINLRKIYPSKTLRNFTLYANPGIEPRYGEFDLEEICDEVHHFMKVNNKEKYLNAIMCKNLNDEYNPVVRVIPLFIKNIAMKKAFLMYGEGLISSTFSNLGIVTLPDEMTNYVDRVDFMLGRFLLGMPNAAAASYKDKLYITWTSGIHEKEIEKGFFTALVKMGIPVLVESNL